jgi:hypothetical protein
MMPHDQRPSAPKMAKAKLSRINKFIMLAAEVPTRPHLPEPAVIVDRHQVGGTHSGCQFRRIDADQCQAIQVRLFFLQLGRRRVCRRPQLIGESARR